MAGKVAASTQKKRKQKVAASTLKKRSPTPASWKPGESGNPGGREPHRVPLTEIMQSTFQITAGDVCRMLAGKRSLSELYKLYAALPQDIPLEQLFMVSVIGASITHPDASMVRVIWDRAEGPVTEEIRHSGGPLVVVTGGGAQEWSPNGGQSGNQNA